MTRETKIGLLMGLGFIVVFAVLLLQTGPKRQQVDEMSMLIAMQGESAAQRPESDGRLPEPAGQQRPSTDLRAADLESVSEAITRAPEPWNSRLPSPPILNPEPAYRELGPVQEEMTENLTPEPRPGHESIRGNDLRLESPGDAQPTRQPGRPERSPSPESATPKHDVDPSPVNSSDLAARQPTEYVVKKGDSFSKIAREQYNTDSIAVLDFLVRYNSDRVKDRHSVIEGQTIMIPVLPANLKSPADGSGQAGATTRSEPVNLEESANPVPRHNGPGLRPLIAERERVVPPSSVLVNGPRGATGSGAVLPGRSDAPTTPEDGPGRSRASKGASDQDQPKTGGSHDSDGHIDDSPRRPGADTKLSQKTPEGHDYRWYVVQPKDTYISIADKELGGKQNWEEIAKLNKNVKPKKLKVGDRIRLPLRKSGSGPVASGMRSST